MPRKKRTLEDARIEKLYNELEELGRLKYEMKKLEKRVKEQQELVFAFTDYPEEHPTSYGQLKLNSRRNYSTPDNFKLIEKSVITKSIFIQNATMSAGKIKSIVGKEGFNNLLSIGVIVEKSPSYYYTLT